MKKYLVIEVGRTLFVLNTEDETIVATLLVYDTVPSALNALLIFLEKKLGISGDQIETGRFLTYKEIDRSEKKIEAIKKIVNN